MPSIAAGLYEDGSGKDLGGALEFRSAVTFGYRFESGWRAGLFYAHISNASTGRDNPGADTIGISISVPLSGFKGGR